MRLAVFVVFFFLLFCRGLLLLLSFFTLLFALFSYLH